MTDIEALRRAAELGAVGALRDPAGRRGLALIETAIARNLRLFREVSPAYGAKILRLVNASWEAWAADLRRSARRLNLAPPGRN